MSIFVFVYLDYFCEFSFLYIQDYMLGFNIKSVYKFIRKQQQQQQHIILFALKILVVYYSLLLLLLLFCLVFSS